MALFQDLGRYCEIQNLLKTCKMCSVTSRGSCLIIILCIPSGPGALFFFSFFIALSSSSLENSLL